MELPKPQTPQNAAPLITFPKPMVAVVGQSGTGKSTSYRNMDWACTALIDTEVKGLPFNVNNTGLAKYPKHYFPCAEPGCVGKVAKAIADVKKMPEVKYVIIDSMSQYFDNLINDSKTNFKNYDIYNNYADMVIRFLNTLRNDKQIFVILAIDEFVELTDEEGKRITRRRLATHGRQMENKIDPHFLVILFTTMKKKEDGRMEYLFQTQTDGMTSAKSPMGMFPDLRVGNDLKVILERIEQHLAQ